VSAVQRSITVKSWFILPWLRLLELQFRKLCTSLIPMHSEKNQFFWVPGNVVALFPGLHTQLLSLAVQKAGRRPGRVYHVMCAAADVMFSLLTSWFVLSPSLFFPWIQFILSVQFVLRVWLLLDRSWVATIHDVSSGTSRDKSVQAFSPLFVLQATKAGCGGLGTRLGMWLVAHQ